MTTKTNNQIQVKFEHDVLEGWACVSYYDHNGILIASDDGSYTNYYTDDAEDLVSEYIEQNGQAEPDWESYEEAILEASFEQIKLLYPDEWVCLGNSYESDTSNGFSNTYYIESAEEGDTSKFGRFDAIKVSDIDDRYMSELVEWATEQKNYSWF